MWTLDIAPSDSRYLELHSYKIEKQGILKIVKFFFQVELRS